MLLSAFLLPLYAPPFDCNKVGQYMDTTPPYIVNPKEFLSNQVGDISSLFHNWTHDMVIGLFPYLTGGFEGDIPDIYKTVEMHHNGREPIYVERLSCVTPEGLHVPFKARYRTKHEVMCNVVFPKAISTLHPQEEIATYRELALYQAYRSLPDCALKNNIKRLLTAAGEYGLKGMWHHEFAPDIYAKDLLIKDLSKIFSSLAIHGLESSDHWGLEQCLHFFQMNPHPLPPVMDRITHRSFSLPIPAFDKAFFAYDGVGSRADTLWFDVAEIMNSPIEDEGAYRGNPPDWAMVAEAFNVTSLTDIDITLLVYGKEDGMVLDPILDDILTNRFDPKGSPADIERAWGLLQESFCASPLVAWIDSHAAVELRIIKHFDESVYIRIGDLDSGQPLEEVLLQLGWLSFYGIGIASLENNQIASMDIL